MPVLAGKVRDLAFRPTVLVEQVSRILTEAILDGSLKGGDRLVEATLQKELGISRSPVREAFRDLEKKGLVVIVPRKGTFVRAVTAKDIRDNFPVRAALEGLAAREAQARMGKRDLAALRAALSAMRKSVEKGDATAYFDHHLEYHNIFIRASGNEVLEGILRTLRMHAMWYRFSYQYYKEDLAKSLAVHERIFALFEAGARTGREIEDLVRGHIEEAMEIFAAYLETQEPTAERPKTAAPAPSRAGRGPRSA